MLPVELSSTKWLVPPTTQAEEHTKSWLTYLDAYACYAWLPSICVGQQDVLWLEIPVNDPFAVENTHGSSYLLQEYADGIFTERPFCWGEGEGLLKLHSSLIEDPLSQYIFFSILFGMFSSGQLHYSVALTFTLFTVLYVYKNFQQMLF